MSPHRDAAPAVTAARGIGDQSTTDAPILPETDAACQVAADALAGHQAQVAQADKTFQTLRARFALTGFGLYITAADGQAKFVVTRWSQVREFDSLADLEAFAMQVGVTR